MLQGRQEHRAVRLERAGQPDHHALQSPASAVQQREGAPGGDVRASPRRTSCAPRSAIPRSISVCNAPFICGTPLRARSYGDLLIKPDLDKARAAPEGERLRRHADRDDARRPTCSRPTSCRRSPSRRSRRPASRSTCRRWTGRPWCRAAPRRRRRDKGGWNIFFTTTVTRRRRQPGRQLLRQRRLRQGVVRLAVRSRDGEAARRLRARDRSRQAEGDRARRLRPRHGPGALRRARPVQGVRRLPQGPRLGLAAGAGAGVCGTSARSN